MALKQSANEKFLSGLDRDGLLIFVSFAIDHGMTMDVAMDALVAARDAFKLGEEEPKAEIIMHPSLQMQDITKDDSNKCPTEDFIPDKYRPKRNRPPFNAAAARRGDYAKVPKSKREKV